MTDSREPLPGPLAACIGRSGLPWRWEVTTTAIRAHARACGFTDLFYYDLDAARAAGHPELPAPPGFVGLPAWIPGGTDPRSGQPSFGQVDVPHGLEHVIELETTLVHLAPLYAGDVLEGVTEVSDVRARRSVTGTRGVQVTRLTLLRRDGVPVAEERRTTLYTERLPW